MLNRFKHELKAIQIKNHNLQTSNALQKMQWLASFLAVQQIRAHNFPFFLHNFFFFSFLLFCDLSYWLNGQQELPD